MIAFYFFAVDSCWHLRGCLQYAPFLCRQSTKVLTILCFSIRSLGALSRLRRSLYIKHDGRFHEYHKNVSSDVNVGRTTMGSVTWRVPGYFNFLGHFDAFSPAGDTQCDLFYNYDTVSSCNNVNVIETIVCIDRGLQSYVTWELTRNNTPSWFFWREPTATFEMRDTFGFLCFVGSNSPCERSDKSIVQ